MRSAEGLPSLARDNESSPVQVSPSGSIGIDRTSVGRLTLRPTLKYYRNRVNIFRLEYKEHSLIVRGEQLPLDLAHDPIDEVRFSLETDREGDARDLPIHSLNLEMDREEVVGGIPNGGFVSIHSKDIEEFMQHVLRKHGIRPVYRCIKCDRESGHLHSLRGQAGRCDGSAFRAPAPSPALASFDCDHCSHSFLMAISRSQHVRHKHPVVANARRIAARLEQIAKKSANRAAAAEAIGQRRRGCWSDEEVAVLVEKESELKKTGVKQINAAIARFLPGKTAKQVGSKRADLGRTPV
ncbi:transcriptase [Octopus vulgaris]|uniref:Transcriptase n=1 Tax=Octopus vulgaris TaxID=6645 RepID=A0AA36C219_OCTVU|nr:transcriptase [Octopus vulgaris]